MIDKVMITRTREGRVTDVSWNEYRLEGQEIPSWLRCFALTLPEEFDLSELGTTGVIYIPDAVECTGDDLRASESSST